MFHKRALKIVVLIIFIFATASIANAMAAANTIPATHAGDGTGNITGYVVSNIHYNLNAANPANIDSVTFTLDATETMVKVKLVAASTTFFSCTNPNGFNWTCTTTGATVTPSDQLRVIATN